MAYDQLSQSDKIVIVTKICRVVFNAILFTRMCVGSTFWIIQYKRTQSLLMFINLFIKCCRFIMCIYKHGNERRDRVLNCGISSE